MYFFSGYFGKWIFFFHSQACNGFSNTLQVVTLLDFYLRELRSKYLIRDKKKKLNFKKNLKQKLLPIFKSILFITPLTYHVI